MQLIRRLDTRVPSPLLSQRIAATNNNVSAALPNLGKLADLRNSANSTPLSSANGAQQSSWRSAGAPRGWGTATRTSTPPAHPGPPRSVPASAPTGVVSTGISTIPRTGTPPVVVGPVQAPPVGPVPDSWEDD